MSKTVNTESKNTENSDHPTELQEISETFKRENEKIESLEKKVQKLSDEIFDIQKLYTEKKNISFYQSISYYHPLSTLLWRILDVPTRG